MARLLPAMSVAVSFLSSHVPMLVHEYANLHVAIAHVTIGIDNFGVLHISSFREW
jgi:hypothetical protein